MSVKLPTNATIIREMLTKYLVQSKAYINNDRDKAWLQGELDRYNDQIKMLAHGAKSVVKPTGIVRKLDELGRFVLPKEMRRVYEIETGDSVEFFIDTARGAVCIQKYEPACNFCGENTQEITQFRGKRICETCLEELFNQS